MVRGCVPPRHAFRRESSGPAPLSDVSVRSLHHRLRSGRPGALRVSDDAAAGSRPRAGKSAPLSARSAAGDCRLEIAVSPQPDISAGSGAERGMEPGRLSGRGAGALRPLPYAAKCSGCGTHDGAVCRRRRRQLACLCSQRALFRAGAVERRSLVRLFARWLASRSRHCARGGPMAQVVSNWSSVPDAEVRAIAAYMAGKFGVPTPDRKREGEVALAKAKTPSGSSQVNATGASIYAAACASCHEGGRALPYGGVNLALSTAISSPDPRNATNIVLSGVRAVEGERSPIMPGFAASINDPQISAFLGY